MLPARAILLAALFALAARAQFTRLGDDTVLAGTSRPDDGFGPEDKLLPCNGRLVFVDLDSAASFGDGNRNHPPQVTLQKCGTSAKTQALQQWAFNDTTPTRTHLYLANPPTYFYGPFNGFAGTCLDILGGTTDANLTIYPWICRDTFDPAHTNQLFSYNQDALAITSDSGGKGGGECLQAGYPGEAPVLEARITTAACDPGVPGQNFLWDPEALTIRSRAQTRRSASTRAQSGRRSRLTACAGRRRPSSPARAPTRQIPPCCRETAWARTRSARQRFRATTASRTGSS